MALLLGIDTGGTYTDAVLYDDTAPGDGVVAKAKALTTRQDLSRGIDGAIGAVLDGKPADKVSLVSISTTLATNALVEGQGGRVCLILIGFDAQALDRAGLGTALGTDPAEFLAGGHTPTGARQAPLDTAGLARVAERHAPNVDAFAVIAYFGTRDPVDEIEACGAIRKITDLPVTCGHELAASLGGPKRALTALLNARLIGMISELISATEHILQRRGIAAPLMLVRGDGSLVTAQFARNRPIETILSGPAASLVGAAHLTGSSKAMISDIGGTTTDIAILQDGRPALSLDGARVGGHHTMVQAVAMTTHGLGGDSEVRVDESSLTPRLLLGPRRVVPVSLVAAHHPQIHRDLDDQLARAMPGPHDARFVMKLRTAAPGSLRTADGDLLDRLDETPRPIGTVIRARSQMMALSRLVSRGLALVAGPTPSDAAHVLGQHAPWDAQAATKALALLARRSDARGRPVAATPQGVARLIQQTLQRRSAEILLDAAMAHDGLPGGAAQSPLLHAALNGHTGATRLTIGLDMPLIGLGASARLYYPTIAEMLSTRAIIPENADVANAVGAVVGQVRVQVHATVSQPTEGLFRAHLPDRTEDHTSLAAARSATMTALLQDAHDAATAAGAENPQLDQHWHEQVAEVEGRKMFIEANAQVAATGRPRLA